MYGYVSDHFQMEMVVNIKSVSAGAYMCRLDHTCMSTSIVHQLIRIVHPYTCFLSTSLAVSVNRSSIISHTLTKNARVGLYYTYVLIIPTTLVCLLFSIVIPTSLFNSIFYQTVITLGELLSIF